ncbi:hypothetical protein [Streptomyces griseosporeus]|uniref:hypothetical protein n=1 Tax=Streptomyces griseosporeus TaxID=1910 RepID=UPI0036FEB718
MTTPPPFPYDRRPAPPVPPPPPSPPGPPVRPRAARGAGAVVEGVVRGAQVRTEYRGEHASEVIWTFRVEQYDTAGNLLSLVPVEMRGLTFEGSLADGDWVRARGRTKAGTLRVTRLENLTTGAAVRAKGVSRAALVVAYVLMAAIAAFVAWGFYTTFFGGPDLPPGFPGDW